MICIPFNIILCVIKIRNLPILLRAYRLVLHKIIRGTAGVVVESDYHHSSISSKALQCMLSYLFIFLSMASFDVNAGCEGNGLKKETADILKAQDLDTKEALAIVLVADVDKIHITLLLNKGIMKV